MMEDVILPKSLKSCNGAFLLNEEGFEEVSRKFTKISVEQQESIL